MVSMEPKMSSLSLGLQEGFCDGFTICEASNSVHIYHAMAKFIFGSLVMTEYIESCITS